MILQAYRKLNYLPTEKVRKMEREFYTDNFENLLKENADQFKMSPSKKVWHGIYNDLHPGRRWPSTVMSLAFIFTLVIIGHLNTQQSQHTYLTNLQKNSQLQKNIQQENNSNFKDKSGDKISQKNIVNQTTKTVINQTRKNEEKITEVVLKNTIPPDNNEFTDTEKNYETRAISINDENKNLVESNKIPITLTNTNTNINITSPVTNDELAKNSQSVKNNTLYFDGNKVLNAATENEPTRVPVLKIRKNSRISWTYFLSPSVSYRIYSKHDVNTNEISNSDVTNHPSAGLEGGTLMKYSLTKKLKFISGFQANYSGYTVEANNIHPVMATLLLYNKEQVPHLTSAISFYGNGPGSAPVNLHNYSLQVSIPVGLEYKIAGNDHVQLNASASLQPLFVVANKAYILSTDKKNYLTQASLSRKWNMSTNFGTYISFNSNKFNWQIGPQLHYQLFSSYSDAYPLREHFINYGVRLGVSKLIR